MDNQVSALGDLPVLEESAGRNVYRWVILAVVWFGFLLSFVDRLIWTSVSGVAAPSFGLSVAALGSFVTSFYVGYVVSQALTGYLTDRLGARRLLPFPRARAARRLYLSLWVRDFWAARRDRLAELDGAHCGGRLRRGLQADPCLVQPWRPGNGRRTVHDRDLPRGRRDKLSHPADAAGHDLDDGVLKSRGSSPRSSASSASSRSATTQAGSGIRRSRSRTCTG